MVHRLGLGRAFIVVTLATALALLARLAVFSVLLRPRRISLGTRLLFLTRFGFLLGARGS